MRLPVPRILALGFLLGALCSGVHAQIIYESSKILPSYPEGWLGSSIAIDGKIAVVGAPADDELGTSAGAAYVYDLSDPHNPVELRRLTAADGIERDQFGSSVAIGDGFIAVGAAGHIRDGNSNAGAAYIFDATTGAELHRLEPVDGFDSNDQYGASIAISGGDVFVGALGFGTGIGSRGAIFRYDAASGMEIARMIPDDARCCLEFGDAFAIDGDILVAGATTDRFEPTQSGSGSVFVFDLATNKQLYKFFAEDPVEQMQFGKFIDLENGLVAVGTSRLSDGRGIYVHDVNTTEQVYELHTTGLFGFDFTLAINGGRLIAIEAGETPKSYMYDAPTGDFIGELVPSESVYQHNYGREVAINGDAVLIGASWDDEVGDHSGAVYVFKPEYLTTSCSAADLSVPYGTLNFYDVSVYLGLFLTADPAADLAEPFGSFDFFDISAFLDLFTAGCP